jgi:arylsulfatase A-like enzyme
VEQEAVAGRDVLSIPDIQPVTPNIERLSAAGLKHSRFHTTALCSPIRSALLTGRNHHSVGMGNIAELATSATSTGHQ